MKLNQIIIYEYYRKSFIKTIKSELNISMQEYLILNKLLDFQKDSIPLKELREAFGSTTLNFSAIINRLIELEYLGKHRINSDERTVDITNIDCSKIYALTQDINLILKKH